MFLEPWIVAAFVAFNSSGSAYVESFLAGSSALESGNVKEAEKSFRECERLEPANANCEYALACCASRQGSTADAVAHLRGAVDFGFDDVALARWDPDLDFVRHAHEFDTVLGAIALGVAAITADAQAHPTLLDVALDASARKSGRCYRAPTPALSAEGAMLAVPIPDGTVFAVDLTTGRGERRWQGGAKDCEFAVLDRQGELLTVEREDCAIGAASIARWSAEGGTPKLQWSVGHAACGDTDRVFTADARRAVTWDREGLATLWDCTKGLEIAKLKLIPGKVNTTAWSADSSKLALGTEAGGVWICDAADGGHVRALVEAGRIPFVSALDFDSSGRRLAIGHAVEGRHSAALIQSVDLTKGDVVTTMRQPWVFDSVVQTLAHDPTGEFLFSTCTGELYEWDLEAGAMKWSWVSDTCGDEWPMRVVVLHDGKHVALVGQPCRAGLFDVAKGRHMDEVPMQWGTRYVESVKLGRFIMVDGLVVRCLDNVTLREMWRRTQLDENDEVTVTPEGWFSGNAAAIHRGKLRGRDDEEHVLESMAPRALDPKRVRAAAAGVVVRPPRGT